MTYGNPVYIWSTRVTVAAISLFLILCAFNYGRLTATQVQLRSTCDLDTADREDLKVGWYQTGSR